MQTNEEYFEIIYLACACVSMLVCHGMYVCTCVCISVSVCSSTHQCVCDDVSDSTSFFLNITS